MSEKESEFDALVKLYTEIKSFKIDNSAKILKNFHSENQPKFKLTAEEKEEKFLGSISGNEKETLKNALKEKDTNSVVEIFNKRGKQKGWPILHSAANNIKIEKKDNGWKITDTEKNNRFITVEENNELKIYKESSRLNLSSTTVCAYTLSQYQELWKESGKDQHIDSWRSLQDYYKFVIDALERFLDEQSGASEQKSINKSSELESIDEFSLLNTLYFLKGIQDKIKEENKDFEKSNATILEIIRMLCKQFIKNRFSSFGEKPHPFIYYKFLLITRDWAFEIFDDIRDPKNKWTDMNEDWNNFVNEIKKMKKIKEMEEKEKKEACKKIFDYFFSKAKIYDDAKYEMYRQIALYNAADSSLFDVKRLIYSLLIVKLDDKYSNNLIKDKMLKLIFEEQLDTNTGLFPIGHVVNTDFVIDKGIIIDKTERIISASPILSSIECLKDMLMHDELKPDLEKYQKRLNSTYEWIIKRLRKDSPDKPLGWFPEYENTHTPESWVSGHTLIFLKKYCEMLSDLIKKNAGKELQVKKHDELTIEWEKLYDSYEIKKYMGYMTGEENGKVVSNSKYRSALIFGPPGSGKSTIAKALAKRLDWDYVELSPSLFLSEGERNIIPRAIEIFKRLVRMKETVIFFDEVDQLVKSRKKAREKGGESSIWIVTALLPMFQKLREQNDIKFILATNDIIEVDTAAKRPGRIDAVLPLGAICWRDRLKILRDAISDENNKIKEQLKSEESKKIFEDLMEGDKLKGDKEIDKIGKEVIKTGRLQDFSRRTDYMPFLEIRSIVERLFNKGDWETVKKAEAFKILFGGEDSGSEEYENSEFKDVHEKLVSKSMKPEDKLDKYVHLPMEAEISKGEYIQEVKNTIFRES